MKMFNADGSEPKCAVMGFEGSQNMLRPRNLPEGKVAFAIEPGSWHWS